MIQYTSIINHHVLIFIIKNSILSFSNYHSSESNGYKFESSWIIEKNRSLAATSKKSPDQPPRYPDLIPNDTALRTLFLFYQFEIQLFTSRQCFSVWHGPDMSLNRTLSSLWEIRGSHDAALGDRRKSRRLDSYARPTEIFIMAARLVCSILLHYSVFYRCSLLCDQRKWCYRWCKILLMIKNKSQMSLHTFLS